MKGLLCLVCAGLALFHASGWSNTPEKLRLQLKWYHQFQFAGYYAAQSKGFYQAEGLDVEIIEGASDNSPEKMVLASKAEFGVHDGADLVYRRLQGDALVALAAIFQHSPYVIISKKSKGIRHPSNLVGRTVLITQDQGSAQILSMFRREGIKVHSTLDQKPVRFAPHTWDVKDLIEERADAMTAYLTEIPGFQRRHGFEPAVLNPLDYGIDFYGDTLFTSSGYAKSRPDVVERFRRASLKGWEYAMAHPEEVTGVILALDTARQNKPDRQALLDEAKAMDNIVLPTLVEMGNMNDGRWEKMAKTYQELGMVSSLDKLEGFVYEIDAEKRAFQKRIELLAATLLGVSLLALASFVWLRLLRAQVLLRTRELANEITERKRAEQALLESEQNLAITLKSIGDAVIATDTGGRVTRMNPTAERLCGWLIADARGHPLAEVFRIVNASSRETVTDPVQLVMAKGQVIDRANHTVLLARDGQEYQISDSAAPIRNENQEIVGVVLVFSDITENHQVWQALRQSEAHYRTLIENIGEGICLVDPGEQFTFANRAAESIFGALPGGLLGRTLSEFTTPQQFDEIGEQTRRRQAGQTSTYEVEIKRAQGPLRRLLVTAVPQFDDQGQFAGTFGVFRDITERKLAEQNAREQSEQLRLLFDASQRLSRTLDSGEVYQVIMDFMSMIAPASDFSISAFNPDTQLITCRAFVMDGQQIDVSAFPPIALEDEGKGTQSVVIRSGKPLLLNDFQAHVKTAKTSYFVHDQTHQLVNQVDDPEEEVVQSALIIPLKINGQVTGVVQVMSCHPDAFASSQLDLLEALSLHIASADQNAQLYALAQAELTERKQTQTKLQQSLRDKEALLKEVHHRVKNNLQVISSLLRLESRRCTQPDTKAVLDEMQGRIRSMSLLHESLYRSGTFASVDLGAYLKNLATQAFRFMASGNQMVRLQLTLGSLQVGMDQAIACGLLVNELISNCLKHSFPGGSKDEVSIELSPSDENAIWRLRVSDTGVGLPADFEEKRKTSLGLQLVSDLSKQLGGTLTVTSLPGQGATFTVIFKALEPAVLIMP